MFSKAFFLLPDELRRLLFLFVLVGMSKLDQVPLGTVIFAWSGRYEEGADCFLPRSSDLEGFLRAVDQPESVVRCIFRWVT